jgi:protein-disulfide isomerase
MATELKVPVEPSDHIQGSSDAPVILVEYGDFECPHCGHAHQIVPRVQHHFKDQLAFVYRHFPLTNIHPHAELAAEAAEAAGAQDKFWDMHDWLFENQEDLEAEAIVDAAEELDLDTERFVSDLENHTYQEKVRADFMGGVRSGVNGTPTFFINGVRHDGDFEYETLVRAINSVLRKAA